MRYSPASIGACDTNLDKIDECHFHSLTTCSSPSERDQACQLFCRFSCSPALPLSGYANAMGFHGYVGVQGRGVVALPAQVRQRLHLDQPGAQVEITEREDGVLELRPSLPVPADQQWFWARRWQERELEVDELVAARRVTVHDDGQALLDHLETLDDADPS